jgi:hypothetical protein
MPASLPAAPPVPNTVVDLMNQRVSLRARTLNDDVEDIFLKLWEEEEFKSYFVPIWREETVEGSFVDDEVCAAKMVRDFAKKNNAPLARNANLASLRHSLRVVARRYGLSRKERQGMVGGEVVENDDE